MQFLEYIPCVGEKHLGLAVVKLKVQWKEGEFFDVYATFKETAGKDGVGSYIQAPAVKEGVGNDGKDVYKSTFVIDSNYYKDKFMASLKQEIANAKSKKTVENQYTNQYGISSGTSGQASKEEQLDMPF